MRRALTGTLNWIQRVSFGLLIAASPVGAQTPEPESLPGQPDWGTGTTHVLTLHAGGFVPHDYFMNYASVSSPSGTYRYLNGGPDGFFFHSLELQSGALVEAAAIDGCDEDATRPTSSSSASNETRGDLRQAGPTCSGTRRRAAPAARTSSSRRRSHS